MNKISKFIDLLIEKSPDAINYIEYQKGDIIHFAHSSCSSIDILNEGEIMMLNISLKGNEEIFNYIKAPYIYGNNLLFATNNYYLGDIIACQKCKIIRVHARDLMGFLLTSKEALSLYLNIIADKSLELSKKLKILAIQNIKDRFIAFLEMNINKDNYYEFSTITSIAKNLSVPRETLSRIISKLIKEEKITIIKKRIYIN